MKFVTVMDMWLLIMNGILLGSILYYGRRLIKLVAKTADRRDNDLLALAKSNERTRLAKIIEGEIAIFETAESMGDEGSRAIVDELKTVLSMVKK